MIMSKKNIFFHLGKLQLYLETKSDKVKSELINLGYNNNMFDDTEKIKEKIIQLKVHAGLFFRF